MKRVFVLAAAGLLALSSFAFAGPFFGVDYGTDNLDISVGVNGDIFSGKAVFNDVDTALPSIDISFSAEHRKGNVDVGFETYFSFAAIEALPVTWNLDEIGFIVDSTIYLGELLDTNWGVELNGKVGVVFGSDLTPTVTWGIGIYVEMPWIIPIGIE